MRSFGVDSMQVNAKCNQMGVTATSQLERCCEGFGHAGLRGSSPAVRALRGGRGLAAGSFRQLACIVLSSPERPPWAMPLWGHRRARAMSIAPWQPADASARQMHIRARLQHRWVYARRRQLRHTSAHPRSIDLSTLQVTGGQYESDGTHPLSCRSGRSARPRARWCGGPPPRPASPASRGGHR